MIQPCFCQRSFLITPLSKDRGNSMQGKPQIMTRTGLRLWQQCLNGRYKCFLRTGGNESAQKTSGWILGWHERATFVTSGFIMFVSLLLQWNYFCSWSGIGIKIQIISVIVVCLHCILLMLPFSWSLPFSSLLCRSFHGLLGQMETNKQLNSFLWA